MIRPAILALALLLGASCGGGADETASGGKPKATGSPTAKETPTGGDRVELEIEAEDFSFDQTRAVVPAGAEVELKFKNRDEGIPHTFTLYESEAASDAIFDTGNVIGEAEETFEFTAPEAGTYFFRCDVHPEMNGTLRAQ